MNKQQVEDIIRKIERNWEKIISNPKLERGIAKYVFLKERFKDRNGQILADGEFKSTFCEFYELKRLRTAIKGQYFELLSKSQNKTKLRDILEKLYQIPKNHGGGKVQFSFATKLLHTIDNDRPIYDSRVAHQLKLCNMYNLRGKEAKIEWCETTYKELIQWHKVLLRDRRVKKKIKELRKKFSEAKDISKAKALDFILWSMPKDKKKNKTKICLK